MARKASRDKPRDAEQVVAAQRLRRGAIERIHLGQSFAEYDTSLKKTDVFVRTPALSAAADAENPHCFFVGRRGTGKTTIARYLEATLSHVTLLRPQLFSPSGFPLALDLFRNTKQKPFRSLLAAFKRSLIDEVMFPWVDCHPELDLPRALSRERDEYSQYDFDLRSLRFIAALTRPLVSGDDISWLEEIKTANNISKDFASLGLGRHGKRTILIDAIDDYWDGSDQAVIYLTALMHAIIDINSHVPGLRVLLFLRENIFERVRTVDSEFSRLETCVVGLDWTKAQLEEMIERRVNAPLNTKLALGGPTWNAFFEDGQAARELVFTLCQPKPRDVLTYCNLALDTAQADKHSTVLLEDLQDARRRFSDSRLKDLGDEYQENYPQIEMVLERFYGLGRRFTVGGIEDFIHKLNEDTQVTLSCGSWLYDHATVERFVRLLFDIGFVGLQNRRGGRGVPVYRTLGPRDTTPPPVMENTDIVVHPCYHDALDLQDVLVDDLKGTDEFRRAGLLLELPGALSFGEYQERLRSLSVELPGIPHGSLDASRFEDTVGEILRLCLFRPLTNFQAQVRNVGQTTRKDWIASNRAQSGFWEVVRQRYQATQVVFECKNFADLDADDFHQAAYYMTKVGGKFVVIVFRGDVKKHYFEHVKRIAHEHDGLVLLLNERDLSVFLRQAINGKVKDDHVRERYDHTVRYIS